MTSANARASDVAARLTESVIPLQQQKMAAAFRVQGVQAILYSQLKQGIRCSCHSKNAVSSQLSPDGKASPGTINRVLSGNNFGISNYQETPESEFDDFDEDPTSPKNIFNQWMGDLNTGINQPSDESRVNDDGQSLPDIDDILGDFDLGSAGFSDVSCPICFGSSYVGGYSMYNGQRIVIVPKQMQTTSVLDLHTFELSAGRHQVTTTFPRGAVGIDVFRAMRGDKAVPAKFFIDNQSIANHNILRYCDGMPHTLAVEAGTPITHLELQFVISDQSVYFEFPKRTKTSDLSLLEQEEPFQIIVSPDVPIINTLDVIAESQSGKLLLVTNANVWNSRNRQMLGHEVMVRVTQPQELYRILPIRRHVAGQKVARTISPAKSRTISGLTGTKGFTF
jgi:hypothetical protein